MNLRLAQKVVARTVLFTAYFSCLLQWVWLLLVALPPLIESGMFDSLSTTPSDQAPVIQNTPIELSPLGIWFIGGVTIAILILTVVVLIKIPRTILTTSERMVEHAAQAVVPVVTHHRQLPAKKRRMLSRRLKLVIQCLLAIIPGIVSLFLPEVDTLTRQIIITIGLSLMAYSLVAFVVAWLLEPAVTTSQTQSHASRG